MENDREVILSANELTKLYPVRNPSLIPRPRKYVHAADGVSLTLRRGETLGLVGESGCGKSTVGRLIVGLERPTSGQIHYKGRDLAEAGRGDKDTLRTELQMIFQDSYSSLNPRKRIYDILADPMLYHRLTDRAGVEQRVDELLVMVGLPADAKRRYPHEFSGGQRQRISIARALSLEPKLIVCDEPVSALDMSIQAQILNLLKELQEKLDITCLFISHSLGAVRYVSDRIAVMYLGRIVEIGDAQEIIRHPQHPYTQTLVSAVPLADPQKRNIADFLLEGEVPSAIDLPKGCRFAPRCRAAMPVCREREPGLRPCEGMGGEQHLCACFAREEAEDGKIHR